MPRPAVNRNNSTRAIARRTGLNISSVSRILNGKRNPSLATATRVATAMRVSVDRLIAIINTNRNRGVPKEVSQRITEGMKRRKSQDASQDR